MKKCLAFLLVLILSLPITVHSESATATLQEMYAQAELLMVQGDYIGAAAKFEALGAYTDASQMTMYCKAIAAAETLGMYSMAIDAFNDLGDFKDSAQLAIYYQGRSYESASAVDITSATDSALKEALFFAEEAQKIYGGLAFFKDSMTRMAACNTKISDIQGELNRRAAAAQEETYQKALALEQSGNFADAISLYKSLGNYKDSQERIAICETGINEAVYQQALALEQSGNYAEAIELYETIIHYKDSAEKIMGCIYQQALTLEQGGDYAGAIELYQSIKDYKDSADRIVTCQTAINEAIYQQALALLKSQKYWAAIQVFDRICDYKDSLDQINICVMNIRALPCTVTQIQSGESVQKFTYDANGRLISMTETSGSNYSATTTYEHDKNGQITKGTRVAKDTAFAANNGTTELTYNSHGDVISAGFTMNEYTYGEQGEMLSHRVGRGENFAYATYSTFTYDYWYGIPVKQMTYNSAGELVCTTTYTYDEIGNLVSEISEYQSGNITETTYKY